MRIETLRYAALALACTSCVLSAAQRHETSASSAPATAPAPTPSAPPPATDVSHFHPGAPGCGLAAAAFCDTFDAPAVHQGRAGELDDTMWSAARMAAQFPSGNGRAIGVGPATIPPCRADLPTAVEPDRDALICDANATHPTPFLLVAAAEQNYGQGSFRIRQPFDFANRTGTIVFDAEPWVSDFGNYNVYGWISLDVTEDPIGAPSFTLGGASNNEGAMIPKNAFEMQFRFNCAGVTTAPAFALDGIEVYDDYVITQMKPDQAVCLAEAQYQLSHFEIDVSQTQIDVYATPTSADGVTFAPSQRLYSAKVQLPFSRGYVQLSVHNHATMKYSEGTIDAWVAGWDNVGFDGPIVTNTREYSVPDSLIPGAGAADRTGPVVDVGYRVADAAQTPNDVLHIAGVDLTGATHAMLSLSAWYLGFPTDPLDTYVLRYRVNGHGWHDRPLNPEEIAMFQTSVTEGAMAQMMEVPLTELAAGDNTLELVSFGAPQTYPPVVANIDLVLTTSP